MESSELIEILRTVRDRVRASHPETSAGPVEIPLPDLMPLVHARDAALGKVAAIGSVNPRRGGPLNAVVQTWKRFLARVLDWHVREQVEFNRKVVTALDAAIEALNDSNRALIEFGNRLGSEQKARAELQAEVHAQIGKIEAELQPEIQEMKDIRVHWAEWRAGWEHKLQQNEMQFLRTAADLQSAFQHRVTLMDAGHREALLAQNKDFHAALEQSGIDIQKRLWADLERIRLEYEHIIYSELREIRKRVGQAASPDLTAATAGSSHPALSFDYLHFAEKFRGPEEYVKTGQRFYLPYFERCRNVLDLGCGRGEFLEMMRDAGIPARGIDLGEESVAMCRRKGLEAETADLFAYLAELPEASLDGIFCSQVVEHLPPDRLPELIRLCATRIQRHGVIAIETPNPECLAIFSTHFYLDPTHTRPIPPMLLAFYLEESGLGRIEIHRFTPALDSMPSLAALPQEFRDSFFGSLDYAAIARKL